jgi:hypothetical protein
MKNLIFILFLTIPFLVVYPQDTINVPGDYTTIQAAIDVAVNGDIILVAEDTYYENINFEGKAITVASHFLLDGNETHIANTIIDGSQPNNPDSGSVVYFVSGEDTTSVLCGFTITGGTGTFTQLYDDVSGGGIFLYPSGGKICNNIIEYNSVSYTSNSFGGGILADINNSNLVIENNIIRNNSANGPNSTAGGGISLFSSGYVRIVNNKIISNTIIGNDAWGGGIDCNGPSNDFYIINNLIKGNVCNSSYYGGGGLELYDCTPIVRNNLILENSAPNGGGVFLDFIGAESSKSTLGSGRLSVKNEGNNLSQYNSSQVQLNSILENNTIVYNSATISGGGINIASLSPQFMNFIIWGNTAPSDPQISGNADVQYSDVEGGCPGTGNIDEHPLFYLGSEFFLLGATSPCIDSGNPGPQYNDVEDPNAPGNPLPPAQGTLRNDMGHIGGPASLWGYWDWPLPIELTSFTATTQYGKVILNWSTATEINNLGFEIERKTIGRENNGEWMLVGFREGYGTTTEPRDYSFIDEINGIAAASFVYRLKQIDFDGSFEYSDEVFVESLAPTDFVLMQNYPNPFNPLTKIIFGVPVKLRVSLKIFNSIGEQVAQLVNEIKPAGRYEVDFSATKLPSGVYFYRLQTGEFVETKKMVLLK